MKFPNKEFKLIIVWLKTGSSETPFSTKLHYDTVSSFTGILLQAFVNVQVCKTCEQEQ